MNDDPLSPLANDDGPGDGDTLPSDPNRTAPLIPVPASSSNQPTPRPSVRPVPPASGPMRRRIPTPAAPVPRRPVLPTNPYPYRPEPPTRRDSGLYLPWWSLVLMLVGVLATSFLVVLIVASLGSSSPPANREPRIIIITAPPTQPGSAAPPQAIAATPGVEVIVGADAPATVALDGPTLPAIIFTATPQAITIGSSVIVSGIGADELNVRDTAGVIGTNVLFRLREGTPLTVVDGPTQADGFTWWRVQSPANPSQVGWAVSNYLVVAGGQ